MVGKGNEKKIYTTQKECQMQMRLGGSAKKHRNGVPMFQQNYHSANNNLLQIIIEGPFQNNANEKNLKDSGQFPDPDQELDEHEFRVH